MIRNIKIKNFALIDDITVNFKSGLTAITGETGSGKTIFLEALMLILGKRADSDLIRHGQQVAEVEAEFTLGDQLLKEFELKNPVIISRSIDASGKNTIKVNNEGITLATLRLLGSKIGFVHAQNDVMKLMDKANYLELLDKNDHHIPALLMDYLAKRSNYLELKSELTTLNHQIITSTKMLEYYQQIVEDIGALNLQANELDVLIETENKLSNFESIKAALGQSYHNLDNVVQLDYLYETYQVLSKIAEYDEKYDRVAKRLESNYYELEDAKKDLQQMLKGFDFDENEYQALLDRIAEIQRLERKYQKKGNDLLTFYQHTADELLKSTSFEQFQAQLQKRVDEAHEICYQSGLVLSKQRQIEAKKLTNELISILKQLNFANPRFEIQFTQSKTLLEDGIDEIDFLVSMNEGEPLKPLAKVASGGEKARFMFALRILYANAHNLGFVVFDEIDTGISGLTAGLMAKLMLAKATNWQLIVITHVPQIAAKANHHFVIEKVNQNGRVMTLIKTVENDARVLNLAMMISDGQVNATTLEAAKNLIKS